MATEDDAAAQVRSEDVVPVPVLEVALAEIGRNRLQLLRVELCVTTLGQRVVVDVGRVDLDALPEVVGPELVGEEHRQRERFLATRAARRPEADVRVGRRAPR